MNTDWERVDALTDETIDTSDIPPLTQRFFNRAKVRMPGLVATSIQGAGTVQAALHFKTQVLPGGRVEVADTALHSGESVDVIILLPQRSVTDRRSAIEVLEEAPGHRLFKTAADVDACLRQEREAWDR